MKKNYLFVMALAAMVSCSSDEFVGDSGSPNVVNGNGGDAIQFVSKAGRITRATLNSGTTAEMLDGQFKLYGVKYTTAWNSVFDNYVVFSNTTTQSTSTTSNPNSGWEYVGASGDSYGTTTTAGTLSKAQTIKYWDHAASNYHFVAGSPVSKFTYILTDGNITGATVTGLNGHRAANPVGDAGTAMNTDPVYIADPVNVPEANYRQQVTFNFVRQQSRVRVGVYETIPGYKITSINFYTHNGTAWAASPEATSNIILASTRSDYFVGATDATATLAYDWTGATPTYTFSYTSGTNASNLWYGGLLTGVKAVTSNHTTVSEFYGTDKDRDASGYFTVIPTPSATDASPLLIKCDYTLTSLGTDEGGDGSGETITIHGATAAVPAAFSKWAPNTSYTYLFKISDNTNGKTSTDQDEVGLFPITFDAVAVAEESAIGTITTVSTPAITTYQDGSVSSTGITYAEASGKPIYITVNTDGTLANLTSSNTKLYTVNANTTEADLILGASVNKTEVTGGVFTIPLSSADNETVQGITFTAGKYAWFTPTVGTTYAVEYLVSAAVYYSTSDPEVEGGTKTTLDIKTPAVYQYKVIEIASGD